jgi:sigma-B regulation protein RsbU (phosphoserine phosphatase)
MKKRTKNSDLYLESLLFKINKSIVKDVKTDELLSVLYSGLVDDIKISKTALLSIHPEDGWLFKFGFDEDELDSILLPNFKSNEELEKSDYSIKKISNGIIVIPLFFGSRMLAHLLIQKSSSKVLLKEHLDFLQTVSSLIMTAIENKKWYREFKHKTELNKELEVASNVQQMLIPKVLPNTNQIQSGAYFRPQQHLSGDYYDFVQTGENDFAFCMADVSGKGIPAALLMSNFQANWRTLMGYYPNLSELVKELNDKVNNTSRGEKFITCFIGKYNINTRILSYVNAGHTAPVLFGGENPLLLKIGCSGLGMLEQMRGIKQGHITVPNNSFLLCYTDGVVELENKSGEQFGVERLIELIKKIKSGSPKKINQSILGALKKFKGNDNFNDDVAFLNFKFV